MKRFPLLFLIAVFFAFSLDVHSQSNYPQNYFRSPVDFRILLSGTFGELRSDHFHTGIDIKTRGVEGASVFAAADGYVSRVKVSAFGTGKTIYLTHPNGYVSVYGHLSAFEDKLAAYVKIQQYKQKSFEVDLYLERNQFTYAKSDLIALSGNSGGSGGPHLHFEIRDEKTQEPLNPLLFGFEVKDYIRPTISSIRVYPMGKKPFNLELGGWGENYYLKSGDTIGLPRSFFLGIKTIDKQNDTQNSNGVFEVDLYLDSLQVFGNRQERLNFSTGRDINTFIDYDYYAQNRQRYQRSFVGMNNKLKLYTDVKNNGLIHLSDTQIHQVVYQVKDANGNKSRLKFYAYASDENKFQSYPEDKLKKMIFYADRSNVFESDHLKLSLPSNSLYDSLYFHFDVLPTIKKSYSPIYRLHHNNVPLRSYIKLSIKADEIPEKLKSKTLITRIKEEEYSAQTVKWEGLWATTSIRNFGDYTIVVDTVQPQIKSINSSKSNGLQADSKISFFIKDELSGIKQYNGYLNDKWVLFEYDAKNDLIFYQIEPEYLLDVNKLKIEVIDSVGNISILERTFSKN